MEPETCEPQKLIPCELCGSEAKLLCFCRKCSLCEGCIGKHLVNEPDLGHKPVTFSQSEISALYEKEFTQIREHERKLIKEVSERQEVIRWGKNRLKEEIGKLDAFKCTCLEYVTLAVEMSKQKLAQAAHNIGSEMVEKCESKRKLLEDALRAFDSGETHWIHQVLEKEKDKVVLWNGLIDVKEINYEPVLRNGIEFQLEMKVKEAPAPVVAQHAPDTKRPKEKISPQKSARKLSARPEHPTHTKAPPVKPEPLKTIQPQPHTPRTVLRTLSRKHTAEPVTSEPPESRKKPSRLKLNHTITDDENSLMKKDSDYPSPEPPLALQRCLTDSPSSASATSFGFGARTALIQQTARNVTEMTDMLQSLKSPRSSDVGLPKPRSSLAFGDLSSASPFDSPMPKTARGSTSKRYDFPEDMDSEKSLGSSSRGSFPNLPDVIPEEPQRDKPRLFYITPGSTSMLIRDIEAGASTVKAFEGIENFPKLTFWCATPSGEVFILGGVVNESQPSTIKKSCLIYSHTYDTIELGPNMSTPRYACSAICVKDNVFVTGGIGTEMSPIKDCEKLDLRARKWRRLANMNIPRESHGMTYHAGRIYVAGAPGEQSMETYNPVNDRWALLHFKVSAGGKASICSLGDKIAILHDKALTFAWVDKRSSEHAQELEEKGWWFGGQLVKSGEAYHFLRNGILYQLSADKGELRKADIISLAS